MSFLFGAIPVVLTVGLMVEGAGNTAVHIEPNAFSYVQQDNWSANNNNTRAYMPSSNNNSWMLFR